MIIERIEAIPLSIPFKPGSQSDAGAWGDKNLGAVDSLLVKITTDEGLVGWGETFGFRAVPAAKLAIDRMIAPACIGQDAAQIAPLMLDVQKKLHIFGRSGPVMYGISAVDIALWDLAGKAANAPVHRLLGGSRKTRLPCYASLIRYTDPARVRTYVRQAIDAGFRSLKLHEIELPAIRAAREEAGPDIEITLDVNCPWTLGEARAQVPALREFGLRWLEEPIWPPENFDGLAELRRTAGIPIAAGENASTLLEFDRLMAAGAVDYVQPSPAKMGGITEIAKVFALAAAHNVTVMVHTFYDGPGLLAAIHASAALGSAESMVEWRYFDLEAQLYGSALLPVDGHIPVPDGPGLGLEPDEDVIRTYAARP
ncbi:MAG TPA: mandelate racemase/muconate lactonizing enzyme family protein [Aliidongia sp.]|nr:mandelate racemase/muconate lactonizing enzyme family protein [Aliidongia sp.]